MATALKALRNMTHPPPRILVTGDTGFVGQHVLARWPGATGLSSLGGPVDIRDKAALMARMSAFQPTAVLHLAAMSFVPDSFRSPEKVFEVNFLGTLRLLETLAETGFTGRFVFVGTGDAYGLVSPEALPIIEDRALRPRNPYAVSKAAAEALCFQWSQNGPFEVLMARPFNHIGAGQAPIFAISDFARQIAQIAAGQRAPRLSVGNIKATRDFSDVTDVIRAYELILASGKNGEIYNVCSGVERSVQSLLTRLLSLAGVDAEVVVDPARYRPAEQARVYASYARLQQDTGWHPLIAMDDTLKKIYDYWEKELEK
jgi:GDP-4-dehydro-6-deoxy-D-mannose reductase